MLKCKLNKAIRNRKLKEIIPLHLIPNLKLYRIMLIPITHLIVVLYEIQQCKAKFCCQKKMRNITFTTLNKKGHSPKHKRYVTAMLVGTFLVSPNLSMVTLQDFRLLQWWRLRYKYCVMIRRVHWQLVPDVSKKSTASSGSAVQEEFYLDYLTMILRNLSKYLLVNTAYYSRRIISLTFVAAGCSDTANRRRTEDIKPMRKSSSVFVSYRPASATNEDRFGDER
jgi:hypothetical protein